MARGNISKREKNKFDQQSGISSILKAEKKAYRILNQDVWTKSFWGWS